MNLNDILRLAVSANASDIHFKVGRPPMFRINSVLKPISNISLGPEEVKKIAYSIMREDQITIFEKKHDLDTSYTVQGVGRFRVNIFQQRNMVGLVLRVIPINVKTLQELKMPPVIERIAESHRGLILVTGTTGSGKSTTLAAMIEHINSKFSRHIMTIEDPIEMVFNDKKSLINQREVKNDTESFALALRQALRQDPDVIFVGEMRDLETIEIALQAAETGHLVMSTLHTLDAKETITRILSVFPIEQQKSIRLQLANIIQGIISQRLIPKADGKGRVAAMEILVSTSRVRECIREPEKTHELNSAIAEGYSSYGMQTFDQCLLKLLKENIITEEEAFKNCSNIDDFKLAMKGIQGLTGGEGMYDEWIGESANEDYKFN